MTWKSWASTYRQRDLCLLDEGIPFFSPVLFPRIRQNLAHLPVSFHSSLQDDPSRGWRVAVNAIAPVLLHSSIFLTASADAVWNFPGLCNFSWLMWLYNWGGEGGEDDRLLKAFKKILPERITAHRSYMKSLIRFPKQQYLKALVLFSWLAATSSFHPTDEQPVTGRANIRLTSTVKESFTFSILFSPPQ